MTASHSAARDAVFGLVQTAWDAHSTSSGLILLYDGVHGDGPPKELAADIAAKRPTTWGRVGFVHTGGGEDTFPRGAGGKDIGVGTVTLRIFTPFGDNYDAADAIATPILMDLRRASDGDLTLSNVIPLERGKDPLGPWLRLDVQGGVTYYIPG